MSTTSLQATNITQPLAGKRIQNSKKKNIKSPSTCRDGDAAPSYHPWEIGTLNNFIKGKQIQCGRKSTYHCNLKTVKWIKGYRNTCPIAGCCGTFNRPAPLILNKFNFDKKNITKKIKISNVQISYQHYVVGVDVGASTGSIKKSWAGYFPYVDITLYKNSTKIQTIRHNKAVPLAKNSAVNVSFTKDIDSFNPQKDDLKIEINYPANGAGKYYTKATNPSIIYAKDLKVNIEYKYLETPKIQATKAQASISVVGEKTTIITDSRNPNNNAGDSNCRDALIHTIKYTNTKASDIIVNCPDGVKYATQANQDSSITYTYQDISEKTGEKTITYSLNSDSSQKIIKKYTAILPTKPTIQIQKKYIKNQAYRAQDKYITVSNNCWKNIKIYIDGNQKLLIGWTNNNINQANFLKKINQLSCDNHILNVYIDDVAYKEFPIVVQAPQIIFESNLQAEYDQNKHNDHVPITIRRVDNNELQDANGNSKPITLTIIDTAEKSQAPQEIELFPQETWTQDINIHYPGTFELKCIYNNGCKNDTYSFGKYVVHPTHTQFYNDLLIRTEDTNIEYESIVIRKGDNQRKPFAYTDATLMSSMTDVLLFGKDGFSALGELGYGILAVKNLTQQSIKNLCIELNPLIESDDEDDYNPLIMEWKTGMLQNFVDNFNILNTEFKDIVDIFNIQNQSLINEGTENVVLCIKEIKPFIDEDNIIELKIPFFSSNEREIYMNFLMLGEPTDFIDLDNEMSGMYSNQEYYLQADPRNSYLFASNTAKQADRGCMCISLKATDLLSAELSITGDDLDRNDLTNTDDLDIEYNIELSNEDCDKTTSSTFVKTQITNDAQLVPIAYQINNKEKQYFEIQDDVGNSTTILDEDGNIRPFLQSPNGNEVYFTRGIVSTERSLIAHNVFLRYADENNQIQFIRATTNKNGIAKFQYTIPTYYQDNEDKNAPLNKDVKTKYYLPDILNTVDIFYKGDAFYQSTSLSDTQQYQTKKTKISIWGIIYKDENGKDTFIDTTDSANNSLIQSLQVEDFDIVGQLYDKSTKIGINDAPVEYQYPYTTTSTNQKYTRQSTITSKNTTTLYGKDKQDMDGFFKIHIPKAEFSHKISFSKYKNKTREAILDEYADIDTNQYTQEISGICSYVVDGDTLDIQVQTENNTIKTMRVRLVGVNTPEKNVKGYATSKQFVEKICLNQEISLDIDNEKETDAYGRTLAIVIVNNKNLNQILLEEGLAEVMYIPPSEFNQLGESTPRLYNLNKMIKNGVISYNGDLIYNRTNSKQNESLFNDANKKETKLEYIKDYGIYRRGETIEIMVKLTSHDETQFVNKINIERQMENCNDTIHIFYHPCSTKNTEGFKTIFKTNSQNLIPNQVEEKVYCGVETDLKILAKLQKKIVENHNINILTINAINGYKPNKKVLVKALIGPEAEKERLGDYLALSAVDIDKEKYSYDQSSDVVYWKIGNMNSYETQICNILLEGEQVGDNTIYVCGFDYLFPDEEKTIITDLTLVRDDSEPEQYFVGDTVKFKAFLKANGTNQDIYGKIYFDIRAPDIDYKTTAQADITTFNGEHYAVGHAKLPSIAPLYVNAYYEGAKMLSITYQESNTYNNENIRVKLQELRESSDITMDIILKKLHIDEETYYSYENGLIDIPTEIIYKIEQIFDTNLALDSISEKTLIYDNIKKYDTNVQLESNQDQFKTNENIQIIGSVLYDNNEQQYFDPNLNIKFFIENQELTNILFIDKKYVVNFIITEPGEYTITTYIPETNKTEASSDTMIINVEKGDDDE